MSRDVGLGQPDVGFRNPPSPPLKPSRSALLRRTAIVLKLTRGFGIKLSAGVCGAEEVTCLVIQKSAA
jgi:hypothetical protein